MQMPTSCPNGMSSELLEPRKNTMVVVGIWHALHWPGVFITFLLENFVEEDLCILVSVYTVA